MKLFVYSFVSLIVIVGVMLIALSVTSRKQPELGLVDGQLQPCPKTPNCVCSEYPSSSAWIEPLSYPVPAEKARTRLEQVIEETGGEVTAKKPDYLHAVYKTPLLRFVDDVEFRLDAAQAVIHVRSASRVGHSDLGANRQRVENIRKRFAESR
ncbi:DUF1499 domain-containing protein [Thiohalophilus sp.]|uniref:DUF1499 domain-containing protein n=1 Tax=Thiohalophilus sp. TaxID=3028392 RepID=UPI003975CBDD